MSEDRFARDMLPSLLGLAGDAIPNVRITVSKVLATHILTSGTCSDYFCGSFL